MSFITKRHIPRRTFLQGRGRHAGAAAARGDGSREHRAGADGAGQPKPRFVGVFFPHGMGPGHWEPEAKARCPTSCPTSWSRSTKLKDQTVVLSGLWSQSAEPPEGTTGSDHWVAAAYPHRHQAAKDGRLGRHGRQRHDRSADRAEDRAGDAAAVAAARGARIRTRARATAAKATAARTRTRSRGSSCRRRRMETVPRTSPLPMELNPQVVFERLFGSGSTPEVRAQRMKQSRSILDSLVKELGDAAQAARRPATCARSTSTPTRFARSSAAFSSRRRRRATSARARSAARHSGAVRRAHPPALRTGRRWRSRPTSPAS